MPPSVLASLTTADQLVFIYSGMQILIFGLMAYRTVPLVRRELDKQLTIMVLVQIVYNFLTLLPNFIVYIISFIWKYSRFSNESTN
jgi:hypothetical protein